MQLRLSTTEVNEDFDGVFSAIITYRQLLKQGIKPKNIRIEGIQYGDTNEKVDRQMSSKKGQMVALVDFARLPEGTKKPDFWSDHHQSDEPESKGGGRTGATEFKSDASHLALLHTNNMVDGKTIDIVNKIDSAGYTKLEEILKLPKNFKESRRLERLGILCNALLTKSNILKNTGLLSSFIKETQPSIVSFYNNILKYVRLNKIQDEAIKEISKENPDWDKIEKSRKAMPSQKAKEDIKTPAKLSAKHRIRAVEKNEDIDEGALEDEEELQNLKKKGTKRTDEEEKRYKELVNKDIDILRARRETSAEKAKTSGDFKPRGATITQTNPKLQRYLWTQMNKKGLKHPFVIKKYATFIQIAINPELPKVVKDYIDLGKVAKNVLSKVRNKFGNRYNDWAFNVIEKESGGHKGITNISGLGTLGLMKKADREELKYLESLESRINSLKNLGSRKLDEKDKEKLDNARKMLKKKTTTPEEKEKYQKIVDELSIDKKTLSSDDKERLKEAKKMLRRTTMTDLDKEYYTKLEKTLAPTMEKMMPEKAKRLKELKTKKENTANIRKKIMREIIEEFQNEFEEKFKATREGLPLIGKTPIKLEGGKKEYELENENVSIDRMKQISEY
jgi:hypothetical protein